MNAETFPPGVFLKDELEARNWSQVDFSKIIGKSARLINEIIHVKRTITPETAKAFAAAFGTSAQLWLNLESSWQLSLLENSDTNISRKAALYDAFPVSLLMKRGWISQTESIDVLESNIFKFFGISSITEKPRLCANFSRSNSEDPINSIQSSWLYRSYNLAKDMPCAEFDPGKVNECIAELKFLMSYPESTRDIPKTLGKFGIRFVIVQQLSTSKIDGVCFWLNDKSPVIALTLRIGRVDNCWFTLMHEMSHLENGDGKQHPSIDIDLFGESEVTSAIEKRANNEASENILNEKEFDNFIAEVSPIYSEKKISGFARKNGIWPGLVVGRLQHHKEIPFSSYRNLLPDVREAITSSGLTDGWGYQLI